MISEFDETRSVGIAEASTTCTCGNGTAWSWSEFLLILNVSLKLIWNDAESSTNDWWVYLTLSGIRLKLYYVVNINCSIDIKYCNIINCLICCLIWLFNWMILIGWLKLEFPYLNGIKTPTLPAVKRKNSFSNKLIKLLNWLNWML